MKKIIKLATILLLITLLAISCSAEKNMDGKTAETKKQMSSAEYSENRKAIQSVSVVEAYAVAFQDEATPSNRGLDSGEYKLSFKETTTITKDDIVSKLEKKIDDAKSEAEIAFYNSLIASLNNAPKVEVKAGSYVNFRVDKNGIAVVSSLDITIIIDGKPIEIEKDADDKWIEIGGTFFDDTELEKMLDAAEDAAESIEEFFNNLKIDLKGLQELIEGKAQEIKEGDFGKDAKATGSYSFSFENNVFVANFNYEYFEVDEEEEKIKVEGTISFNFKTLEEAFSALFSEYGFENFIEKSKDTIDVKISVNGMEVWADAFLDELD